MSILNDKTKSASGNLRILRQLTRNETDVLVLQKENDPFKSVIMHHPETGFRDAVFMSFKDMTDNHLERLSELKDISEFSDFTFIGDFLTPAHVKDFLNPMEKNLGIMSQKISTIYADDHEADREARKIITGFFEKYISKEAQIFMHSYNDIEMNFLSTGDTNVRLQALFSHPVSMPILLQDINHEIPESLYERIDQRLSIKEDIRNHILSKMGRGLYFLVERLGTSKEINSSAIARAQLTFQKIEKNISSILRDPDVSSELKRGITYQLWDTTCVSFGSFLMDHSRVPQAADEMLSLLKYVKSASKIAENFGVYLSHHPDKNILSRHIASFGPDGWSKGLLDLGSKIFTRETQDYINATCRSLTKAIIFHKIKQSGVDMQRLQKIAEDVWSEKIIEKDDYYYMKNFIDSLPAGYRIDSNIHALKIAFGALWSVKSLHNCQQRWHHMRGEYESRLMGANSKISWSPLIGSFEKDGFVFKELDSSEKLDDQGRKENHCVGGYTGRIISTSSNEVTVIFSIENKTRILSTAEFRVGIYGKDIHVKEVQHKAKSNQDPSEEAQEGIRILHKEISSLSSKDVNAYLKKLDESTANLKDSIANIITSYGVNIFNPDLGENTLKSYRDILHPKLRHETVEELLKALSEIELENCLENLTSQAEVISRSFFKKMDDIERFQSEEVECANSQDDLSL